MNFTKTLTTIAATTLFLAVASASNAAGSQCQVIYGGGEVCNKEITFTLNKLVQTPNGNGNFVDNLNVTDSKYTPGSTVVFKVVITNTGKEKITHARVTDTFPQFLTFVSGAGNYDQNSKNLTFDVNNIEAGASQEFLITAKVADESNLPKDQATICVTNRVNAIEDSGATASDSSQVCVGKVVVTATPTPQVFTTVPPKTIPNTGPEMLPLLGLIPAGVTGFILRRKSKLN